MWDPMSGEAKPAAEVLRAMDVEPIKLGAKEGLAMINGTQLIASLSAQRGGRCDAARFAYMAHETTSLLTYTRYLFFVFKTNFCGCFVDFWPPDHLRNRFPAINLQQLFHLPILGRESNISWSINP